MHIDGAITVFQVSSSFISLKGLQRKGGKGNKIGNFDLLF